MRRVPSVIVLGVGARETSDGPNLTLFGSGAKFGWR